MDKILSARVDEAIFQKIGMLAGELGTSKKTVIEQAIVLLAKKVEADKGVDLLERTFGAWQRDKSAEETVREIRAKTRQSMERYKR